MSTTPTHIEFIQYHQPALESGEYRVTIDQTLEDAGASTKIGMAQNYNVSSIFYVAGERFHILPEHIKSAFPPAHSLGEHANVLPHLMLSRNTLPWEREAISGNTTTPWLALLVIHENEAADATVSTVSLSDLETASTASPWFPGISELEPGQTDDTKIAVLDIKKSLLDQILPDQQALELLTHIRQGKDGSGPDANIVGEDLAVVIANRLPQDGAVNTVYLVSLENRFTGANDTFNDQGAADDDLIRLVKLYSWEFTSTEHFKVSETFLEKASDLSQTIKDKLILLKDQEFFTETDFSDALENEAGLTAQELTDNEAAIFEDFAFGDFANVLNHLDRTTESLRLPDASEGLISNTDNNSDITDAVILYDSLEWTVSSDTTAADNTTRTIVLTRSGETDKTVVIDLSDNSVTIDAQSISDPDQEILLSAVITGNLYLESGFYPLPHKLRGGAQTVSWYHGPLSPQSNTESLSFPAEGSDALLRYYEAISMFDVSYAAAWELGRLLALQNTKFSTELYQWKRRYAKATSKQSQITADSTEHLQGGTRDYTTEVIPSSVTEWLDDLKLLKGIPFNYLVPDEELLPAESIRFFQLDALWIESLLDGAFSIGRVTSNDHALDTAIAASETALTPNSVSGFILRSEAVSGWPGMQIEGYSDTAAATGIDLIRQEYLSKNVLLCLFDGDLQTLDLHLKPEMLHFGVSLKTDGSGNYEKILRNITGEEDTNYTVDVGFTDHVIDLSNLIADIQTHYATSLTDDDVNNQDTIDNNVAWSASPTSADLALQLLEGVERVRFTTASS